MGIFRFFLTAASSEYGNTPFFCLLCHDDGHQVIGICHLQLIAHHPPSSASEDEDDDDQPHVTTLTPTATITTTIGITYYLPQLPSIRALLMTEFAAMCIFPTPADSPLLTVMVAHTSAPARTSMTSPASLTRPRMTRTTPV